MKRARRNEMNTRLGRELRGFGLSAHSFWSLPADTGGKRHKTCFTPKRGRKKTIRPDEKRRETVR